MVDTEQFRIKEKLVVTPSLQKRRRRGSFLKGPIPLAGIAVANSLPGKAGAVYLLVWYLAGVNRSREALAVTPSQATKFGLGPRAVRRGLAALESVGLVSITRGPNRAPRVTIESPPQGHQP